MTGASSGIGAALVLRLAERGDRLAIAARPSDRLEAVAAQVAAVSGVAPTVLAVDLAVPGGAAAMAARALDELGGIDVLVNNAGGGAGGTVWRAGDGAEAREAFEVNHWSPLALLSVIVPVMLCQGSGVVVSVTSLGQVMAWPMMSPYTATKAAFASSTETLRLELAGTGVRVLEVVPGPVATAVQAESALLPGFAAALRRAPVGDPDQLARRILRAIDDGTQRLVYPRSLALSYVLPTMTRWYVGRQSRRLAHVVDDDRILRSGSAGAADAVAARTAWFEQHGTPSSR